VPAIAVVLLLAAVPVGIAWEWWQRRLDAKREFRRNCVHDWGDIHRLDMTGYFYRHCKRCKEQMHCNRDGSPIRRDQTR
jgi:hypothetical protein